MKIASHEALADIKHPAGPSLTLLLPYARTIVAAALPIYSGKSEQHSMPSIGMHQIQELTTPMTIFEEIQPTDGPDIGKPFVLINDSTSSEETIIPEAVNGVFGPLNLRNVIYTTVDRLAADIPHLSTQQLNDFVSGKPVITMLVPMPIDLDVDRFKDDWRERERFLRKALGVNVVAAVQRVIGLAGGCDHTLILRQLADSAWEPRADDDGLESAEAFHRYLLWKLYEEGVGAISAWYPGQPAFENIKAALNAEGARLVNSAESSCVAFVVAQFEIVATFFRLYRKAQDVTDLLDKADAAKAEGRKGIYGVFNRLLQPPFTKRDLLVGAFNGDFDPTELSPHHRICRPQFEEMRRRGQQYRASTLLSD